MFVLAKLTPNEGDLSVKHLGGVRSEAEAERIPYGKDESSRALSKLLRDIIGNPFGLVTFEKAWLTPEAVLLAGAIYDGRAFERMGVLADTLQNVGCKNADILEHCRGPGPHVRGCWFLDLVLGKQ